MRKGVGYRDSSRKNIYSAVSICNFEIAKICMLIVNAKTRQQFKFVKKNRLKTTESHIQKRKVYQLCSDGGKMLSIGDWLLKNEQTSVIALMLLETSNVNLNLMLSYL